MKRLAVIVVFLLISSLAPPSPAQEKATATCTIEGKVVAAATGAPLGKAWIVLSKEDGRDPGVSTRTDVGGNFKLKDIEPGRYRISAVRNGYVRQGYGQRRPASPGTTLSLAPGQTLSDIVFRLIPAAVIAGHVYDEDGEAAVGVMVQALQPHYIQGKRELAPAGWAGCDDLGQYRIFGLAPGQYYISANPLLTFMGRGGGLAMRPPRAGGADSKEGYSPTFYPGTLDTSQAIPVEIHAGEEAAAIDFTLAASRAVRVRGRIFNAITSQPGRGVLLVLSRRDSGVRIFAPSDITRVDDPQGAFEISGVTPGAYELRAQWSDGEKQYSNGVRLDVGTTDLDDVNLVISPGVQLSGRVRVEGVEQFDFQAINVALQQPGEGFFSRIESASVHADGTFALSNVSAGDYRVDVQGLSGDWYLKSARWSGYDVLEGGITITAGQGVGSLDLTLSPHGGRVQGTVVDENQQPVQAARVVLIPDPPRRAELRLFVTATSDQYGRYTLGGITPGDYRVFSWKEVEAGAYQDPEFLKPYEGFGEPVSVKEGDQLSLQVKLIPSN
jgi:protocatechuate 3,4-dioxygenase beta subunit